MRLLSWFRGALFLSYFVPCILSFLCGLGWATYQDSAEVRAELVYAYKLQSEALVKMHACDAREVAP